MVKLHRLVVWFSGGLCQIFVFKSFFPPNAPAPSTILHVHHKSETPSQILSQIFQSKRSSWQDKQCYRRAKPVMFHICQRHLSWIFMRLFTAHDTLESINKYEVISGCLASATKLGKQMSSAKLEFSSTFRRLLTVSRLPAVLGSLQLPPTDADSEDAS